MPGQRPPAALVGAVVLAVLQTLAGGGALGLGVLAAAGSSAADAGPWSGFGVLIAAAVALAGGATVLLVGVPLLVLRGATATRRVTGRGLLIGGELVLLLPWLVFAGAGSRGAVASTDPLALAADVVLVVPLLVTVCLLVPSVGRWARAPGRTPATP